MPRAPAPIIVALMQPKPRSWRTGMVAGTLPIAGLITMLLALAFLQLRWSTRVSEAERARLQQNLQRSAGGFQFAFARDLLGICQTLQASQPRDPRVIVDQLFNRYTVWRRISRHAALIGDLYIWPQAGGEADTLLKFNPQTRQLEPVAWPESMRLFAAQARANPGVLPHRPRAWVWNEQVPLLIHPVYAIAATENPKRPALYGYLLVVFNPRDFERAYLPDLGRRYFPLSNGFVFQLIERENGHELVAYQSDNPRRASVFQHADAIIPLLDGSGPYRPPARPAANGGMPIAAAAPVYLSVADDAKWQIAVRHRSGSVDAAVTSLRRRDLAVSIIVLIMLLVSLLTILAATRRARRLARLQMEFASGVSHELRTPLAVISSAAENLADGVVTQEDRIRDYGMLIHQESQRLSGMVDHILDFAQLDSQAPSYRLESVAVRSIVEAVLANERPLIEAAGVSVDVNIPSDVPLVLASPSILQQCLQNLVSNAVKYGSDGGRIILEVSTPREDGDDRLRIRVQDFGAGISPEELSHIYEPFYRASSARDSQIRGTGLGLSLTRKMIEGMGGRITVESSPGKGSAFTLHIPIAPTGAATGRAQEPSRTA
ncbi:MAG: HAMP domain-containing sensor histidine kinase [Acidobacteriaceae bacterium]